MEGTIQISAYNADNIHEKKPLRFFVVRDIPYAGDRGKARLIADRFVRRYGPVFLASFNSLKVVDKLDGRYDVLVKRIVNLEKFKEK